MTGDGSEDQLVTPEDLSGYKFLLTPPYLPVVDVTPVSGVLDTNGNNQEDNVEQSGEELEEPDDENMSWEDNKDDR